MNESDLNRRTAYAPLPPVSESELQTDNQLLNGLKEIGKHIGRYLLMGLSRPVVWDAPQAKEEISYDDWLQEQVRNRYRIDNSPSPDVIKADFKRRYWKSSDGRLRKSSEDT